MSVRKEFRLDEKDIERFEIIKDRHGFRTDAQVLRYLLREGVMTMQADADVIARKVVEVLEKKNTLHVVMMTTILSRKIFAFKRIN